MNQITFGTYRSFDDLYLICSEKVIGSPTIKTNTVAVEGGDGVLDFTEFFGEAKYNNRTLSFTFSTIVAPESFPGLYSQVLNLLHGKKMKVILDEDADFYYIGRINVADFTKEMAVIGKIPITADCEPYKYKKDVTVVAQAVNGSVDIALPNLRQRVVPTITTDADMTITFDGKTVTAAAGTFTIPELELVAGNNVVSVTGTGNITFTYQEGGL